MRLFKVLAVPGGAAVIEQIYYRNGGMSRGHGPAVATAPGGPGCREVCRRGESSPPTPSPCGERGSQRMPG